MIVVFMVEDDPNDLIADSGDDMIRGSRLKNKFRVTRQQGTAYAEHGPSPHLHRLRQFSETTYIAG